MSRKKIPEGFTVTKAPSFNSLAKTLEEPRSLLQLVPEDWAAAILRLPEEWVNVEEEVLEERLRFKFNQTKDQMPTATVEALRVNFWMEHDRVAATRHELMNMDSVYFGVCTRQAMHKMLNEANHNIAWILCRPPQYEAVMNSLVNQSTKRLRDFLNIPLKRPDGEYQDTKLLELVLKASVIVDLRVKGGYLQRSETKNLTYMEQHHTKTESVEHIFSAEGNGMTADEMQRAINDQIKQLELEVAEELPQVRPKFEDAVLVEKKDVKVVE